MRLALKRDEKRGRSVIMLRLENLSFEVNDDKGEKGIIKDISLTVDDGKFVVITGPNGGGKSTLCQLIPRFYDVTDHGNPASHRGKDLV